MSAIEERIDDASDDVLTDELERALEEHGATRLGSVIKLFEA